MSEVAVAAPDALGVPRSRVAPRVALVLGLASPFVSAGLLSEFGNTVVVQVAITLLTVAGLHVLVHWAGQISLAQVALMGPAPAPRARRPLGRRQAVNRRHTLLGWLLVVAGFAAIGGGWAGVQSTPVVAVQLAYLASGGLSGVALVILGTGLQRHDDLRAIREVVEELRERFNDLELDVADTKDSLQSLELKRLPTLEPGADRGRTAS